MKKFKTAVSVMLVLTLLLAVTAMSPVQSAVIAPDGSVGGNAEVHFDPGSAYREHTSWYALYYWNPGDADNGTWKSGTWIKDDAGTDLVYFDFIGWYVIFVCVPDSEASPSLDKAVFKSPEIDTEGNYSNHIYTVTNVTDGDIPEITGKWSKYPPDGSEEPTTEPTEPEPQYGITDFSFDVLKPLPSGTYHAGEAIEIQAHIKMYIYDDTNSAVIEISKDGTVVHVSVFHYRGVGMYPTDEYTPTEPGIYTVRAGYSISKIDYVNDNNCIGAFNFEVLPAGQSVSVGDVDGNGAVDIRDVTSIQRYLAESESFTDEQLFAADTNGDKTVDIADATLLQQYLAEYDVTIG